jgi:uridine phosphorylase
MQQLSESELILNPDGSVYHLKLLPEDIAGTILTVGDPERVQAVSNYFDRIEVSKQSREFATQTGYIGNKRLTVLSTGIGTDNIDIVLNELDALVNIDFTTRTIKSEKTSLNFIRIGTSGAVLPELAVDSFLLSTSAIGMDGLLHFYDSDVLQNTELRHAFSKYIGEIGRKVMPYSFDCDPKLKKVFSSNHIRFGVTVTNAGFYAPQGRKLRATALMNDFLVRLASFDFEGQKISNLEMETAGIYGLASLLGHKAISLNALLANRSTGEFSKHPSKTIDALIRYALERVSEMPD